MRRLRLFDASVHGAYPRVLCIVSSFCLTGATRSHLPDPITVCRRDETGLCVAHGNENLLRLTVQQTGNPQLLPVVVPFRPGVAAAVLQKRELRYPAVEHQFPIGQPGTLRVGLVGCAKNGPYDTRITC